MKNREKIVCFDIDNTLLTQATIPELGEPTEVVGVAKKLNNEGYKVIVQTARNNVQMNTDEVKSKVKIDDVFTGKSTADLYIDDRGLLPPIDLIDAVVENHFLDIDEFCKKIAGGELKSEYAKNVYNAPENKELEDRQDNGSFKVVVPMTGGMDSTTLFNMAVESGYPVIPVYINFQHNYASQELEYARKVTQQKGYELTVMNMPIKFNQHNYILLGRNAIIIFTIAKWLHDQGFWGEIWFGNLAGESPIYGGDKSRKFFNDTQMLLAYKGYNVRIINPLIGVDKSDEVLYWSKQGRDLNTLRNSVSCLSDNAPNCGECQSCFKKWCAFMANGIDIRQDFKTDIKKSFQPFVEKYTKVLNEALENKDFSHYSPAKIEEILGAIKKL